MKEKEIELYFDNRFLQLGSDDPNEPSLIMFFFRDKISGSGFPVVFSKPVAQMVLDATTKRKETPINAFVLVERLIFYTSIKLIKAVIYELKNDRFHTKLHFLINKKEIVEETNTAVAFSTALRLDVPIVIPEKLFIQLVESQDAEEASDLLQEVEDRVQNKNNPSV